MIINDRDMIFYDCIFLKEQHSDIPGMHQWQKLNDFMGRNTCLIDRTGTLSMPIKTKTLPWMGIPSFTTKETDFDNLCLIYAETIWANARKKDQRVAVFWSGGIDSTLALVALLMTGNATDIDRLTILLSRESILEYPWFYENVIKRKIKVDSSEIWYDYLDKDTIVVSGEGGDQLCGSSTYRFMTKLGIDPLSKNRDSDYKKMSEYCENFSAIKGLAIDPLYKKFPGQQEFTATCLWWMNFCLDWQYRYIDILINTPEFKQNTLDDDYAENNWIMFFQDPGMQAWAIGNHHRFFESVDKKIFKSLILKYTQDSSYFQTKKKQSSMMNIRYCRPACSGIDYKWNIMKSFSDHQFNKDNSFNV